MFKRTVLIVDDQIVNRRILNRLLAGDYIILEAENGKEALECLQDNADISAVLLDIIMPVMDGYEVLKRMKEDPELSKIPVIVSSQRDGDEAEVRALSLGAQDFIAKPYKGDIIKHRLENMIRLRETAAMVNKAEKDELTGLYNKPFFMEKVTNELQAHPEKKYILFCFGVERFKLVNDTFGAEKGDELLRFLAGLLKEAARGTGICGRFHSDQFYALLPDKGDYSDADFLPWNERLKEFAVEMDIKVHCGIYRIQDRQASVDVMCDWAQLAAETNRGKYDACFSYYDDSLRQKLFEEQFITSTMQNALEQHQFQVYYQPKYDLHSEMLAGAEALVRWIHPEKGFLSPGAFIPLFEKNGFITQLDRYVWEKVCQDIRGWMDQGYPPVPVSVNVSRADIFNPKLTEILLELVEKYEIPIPYLHLEITESAYTDNPEQIISVVSSLHNLGFLIEMDDFGSGYSSLNMLAELPVDILKLDMRFVQNESTHTSGRGIMSFVISLAKWMKLSVIAEGVETAEQIISLRSMDCNFVQGFYYAKPMPKADFEKMLGTVAIRQFTAGLEDTEAKEESSESIQKKDKPVMLVVDDIAINRAVLGEIFHKEYEIVEKEDGKQAMDYLQQNSDKIEVVLLDLLMPVMDGFQVLSKMNADENLREIPVIVTSQGDVTAEERALDLGAEDFISKPYSPQIVCHRVHNVVAIYKTQSTQRQELNETRKKEQTLMDSIPGGVAIYHMKKNGKITTDYVSEGLAKLCGYTQQEFLDYLKEDARINVASEDVPRLMAAAEESILKKDAIHELQHIYTKDKKQILVRLDANVMAEGQLDEDETAILYAVHTRVSEKAEDAMQEQYRYRYILDNLDVAYFEKDEDGGFYASDKYSLYEMSERTEQDMLGTVHPEDVPVLFEFLRMKEKNLSKISATLRLKMKDGTYRWTEMMGFYEKQKSIGVLRDVDKEWLNQNRKLQEALKNAEKANQTKTEFLARVSHEMRTPLNGILGLTALMKGKKPGEDLGIDLENLEQSGYYLLDLINDTLDVNTIEQGRMELHPSVCDGKTSFENVISMVRPRMDAKEIHFHMQAENLPFTRLYIDAGRVEQAFMNILSNAVKFTPKGGNITFIMENVSNADGIITDRVIIRDDGIGMEEDFLEHIFEPFTQEHSDNKSIYEGTGLGMTIAKQCIELMGGSISVKSKKGEGTEVEFLLPMPIATKEQLAEWSMENEKASLSVLKGRRVLLCEDHPLNAEIAIKLLERKGMKVEHAENGRIGLAMFEASENGYYDAILMDIRMPVMDGLETTRAIRKLKRKDANQVPIIAMTANAMSQDVKNSIDAGMSEHLGKPVEPDRLYHTLAEFISSPNPFAGKKVLVVDDLEMNRTFVRMAIQDTYNVCEAGSGVEALEMLKKEKDIAAVVTDIQMPVMDGKELIQKIREERAYDHVAILANTIYGDHHQEDALLALGANDFVYKPTSPRIILMRLDHIMRNL